MFKHKNVITSAIVENGLDKLKIYLEDLLEKNMSNIIFLVPSENQKVSSWLHKNCYVYEQSYCLDGFSGNKITAKITLEKLNSFKSNFPHIKTNKI